MDMEFFVKFLFFVAFITLTHCNTNCSCDWRYFQHYEIKSCVVETWDTCGCPQKFTCPSNQTEQATAKVCTYQNKEYKVGSKIISSDICQACRCRNGVPPYISCVTRECPQINKKSGEDCHLIYEEDKCCPVDIECFENETQVMSNKSCEYDGKIYPYGAKIYPLDDPCQTCVCSEKFNNGDNSSCYQQDCMFEKNELKLNSGCIPVYHENRCCPVEFYCPSSHNFSYSVLSSNESSNDYNMSYEYQCIFAGQFYALGDELFIDNPCVKCSCLVPPDFTCIHQTCPSPPSEESCYANYNAGKCCPTYECMLGDAATHSAGCPTPVCADSSCHIEVLPGHDCPTCVCGENGSELEHNELEQVEQINQNIEQQFEHVQQEFEPGNVLDDYSEDELQMMPMRMQDSEDQLSAIEKSILPELGSIDQYPEVLTELEENSFGDNFSTEAVNNASKEIQVPKRENSTSHSELDLDDIYSGFNYTEKVVQKRSQVSDAANNNQTEIQQQATSQHEFNKDIEREGGVSDGKNTDFDDELENLRNGLLKKNLTINEVFSINHVVKVPPGCPTPMCEGPWCKIGILPGEKCLTCICKRPSEP